MLREILLKRAEVILLVPKRLGLDVVCRSGLGDMPPPSEI